MRGRPGPIPLLVLLVLVLLDTLILGFFGLTPTRYLSHDTPKEMILLIGVAALLVERLVRATRGRRKLEPAPIDGPAAALLALVLLLVVGALRAHDPALAARRLGVLVAGVALFLEARARIRDPRALLGTLTAIGGIVAVYGIVQKLGWEPLRFDSRGEAPSTLGNRTWAASLLALLIPVGAAFAMTARGRARVFATSAVVLMLVHIVLTRGRAGWVGLAVALLVGAALSRRIGRKLRAALLAAAVVLCAGVVAFTLSVGSDPSARLPVLGQLDTLRVRGLVWRGTVELIAERPVLGHGLGDFVAEYPRVRPAEEYRLSLHREVGTSHNEFLALAAETGIPSVLALLAALFLTVRAARRRTDGDRVDLLVTAGIAGALGLVAAGLFASPLVHPGHVAALFVLLGATVGPAAAGRTRAPVAVLLAALTVAGAFLVSAGILSYRELRCEGEIQRSQHIVDGRLQSDATALRRAVRLSGGNPLARRELAIAEKSLAAARPGSRERHLRAARESCEAILRVRPHDAETRHLLGLVAEDAGQPDLAERWFLEALRQNPGSPGARLGLALLREQQGRDEEALDLALATLRDLGVQGPDAPGDVDLRVLTSLETRSLRIAAGALARVEALGVELGRWDEVLDALRCAETWFPHPDRPDPERERMSAAAVLGQAGRPEEAVEIVKDLVPGLLAADRTPAAVLAIGFVVDRAPALAAPLTRVAERWAGDGRFEEAEALLAGVVRERSAAGDAWTTLERIARRRGDEFRARSYLVRARLAYAREAALAGEVDDAMRHLKVAGSRGAAESRVLYVRAILSVRMGPDHHGAALRHLEAAAKAGYADLDRLKLDARDVLAPLANPDSPNWREILRRVRASSGQGRRGQQRRGQ